ncbi:MAG: hypothetical protein FJ356_05435 [Thaumarchaeota archaeon]|nr:hypothetical protein [Nitrososphaerota archaeon]
MINTEQIFKELIAFIEKPRIEERQYVDDETSVINRFITSSINGHHTVHAIEVVVDCLFQRGFTNFKQQAKRILKEKGQQKLTSAMSYMAGELHTIFKRCNMMPILMDSVYFSEMQIMLNSQDYIEWKTAVTDGVTTPVLVTAFSTAVKNVISNFPDRSKELIREFSSELNKAEFLVNQEFMRESGLELYNALIDSGEMNANFEDFQALCKGGIPQEKIKFKQNSSLTTFITALSDKGVLSTKKHYWTYLANDACELFTGNCDAESLRKNKNQNKNSKVLIAFENIRHK